MDNMNVPKKTNVLSRNNIKKMRNEKKKIRQEKEKIFKLKEDLIKLRYDIKSGKAVEQKSKKGFYHAVTPRRAAEKVAGAILRSLQLEGSNTKTITFTLIEYSKEGDSIKEHVFEATNTLDGPTDKYMGKNKDGKNKYAKIYVKPKLSKKETRKITKNKKLVIDNILNNTTKNLLNTELNKLNNMNKSKDLVNINTEINKLNNMNKSKNLINNKIENNIKNNILKTNLKKIKNNLRRTSSNIKKLENNILD